MGKIKKICLIDGNKAYVFARVKVSKSGIYLISSIGNVYLSMHTGGRTHFKIPYKLTGQMEYHFIRHLEDPSSLKKIQPTSVFTFQKKDILNLRPKNLNQIKKEDMKINITDIRGNEVNVSMAAMPPKKAFEQKYKRPFGKATKIGILKEKNYWVGIAVF